MALTAEGTSKFVTAGGHKIHYHEAGRADAPAVMLLHGGGPGASAWANYQKNIDAFAENYRVIMPDFLGFAQSDKPKFKGEIFKTNINQKFQAIFNFVHVEVSKNGPFCGNNQGIGLV